MRRTYLEIKDAFVCGPGTLDDSELFDLRDDVVNLLARLYQGKPTQSDVPIELASILEDVEAEISQRDEPQNEDLRDVIGFAADFVNKGKERPARTPLDLAIRNERENQEGED